MLDLTNMIRRLLWLFALLVVGGGAAYLAFSPGDAGTEVETVEAARRENFRSWVTASGEIVATRYADIGTDVMGKIVELAVTEGQAVKAQQVLARIDPVPAAAELEAAEGQVRVFEAERDAAMREAAAAEAQLARSRALLREARLSLDRAERLLQKGVVAQAEVDRSRAEFERLRAEVDAAQEGVGRSREAVTAAERRILQARAHVKRTRDIYTKTEIRSPLSGVVSRLNVRQGEMVVVGIQNQPGTTLMTISDLSAVNAEVKVAEAEILRVKLGQPARVLLEAVDGREFSGEVVEIGTSALPSTGTGAAAREFKVVIRIREADPGLRPGLTCDVEILADELPTAVTVPLQAVVIRRIDGEDRTGVFVFREGRAEFQPVVPGVIGGLEMAVQGLDPGVKVVSGPFQVLRELQPGDPVRLTVGSALN
ncbi:MAG: efflux RND transporter periplasmic adaptor subunit [Acidobacteriota bacterium]